MLFLSMHLRLNISFKHFRYHIGTGTGGLPIARIKAIMEEHSWYEANLTETFTR